MRAIFILILGIFLGLSTIPKEPQIIAFIIKEIKLEAFQYGFSPDPVVVKKGDKVRLIITSRDVTHGVYIKEYKINVAIKKGETKIVEFVADKEGEFAIICSVYCGIGHFKMRGKLIVER
jgi:cytochrome c oxidase subunit 2